MAIIKPNNNTLSAITSLPTSIPVGSLTLISTSTTTSGVAQIDITSGIDSTYTKYMISIINLHPASDHELRMRVFTGTGGSQAVDTGSNYERSFIGFRVGRTSEISDSGTDSYFGLPGGQYIDSGVAGACMNATFFLHNPADTTFHFQIDGNFVHENVTSNYAAHGHVGGRYKQTTAVTGVRFYMGSGNIDNATIKLYGIS